MHTVQVIIIFILIIILSSDWESIVRKTLHRKRTRLRHTQRRYLPEGTTPRLRGRVTVHGSHTHTRNGASSSSSSSSSSSRDWPRLAVSTRRFSRLAVIPVSSHPALPLLHRLQTAGLRLEASPIRDTTAAAQKQRQRHRHRHRHTGRGTHARARTHTHTHTHTHAHAHQSSVGL